MVCISLADCYNPHREKQSEVVEAVLTDFDTEVNIVDGIPYWKNGKKIPPKYILDLWKKAGKQFDYNRAIALTTSVIYSSVG